MLNRTSSTHVRPRPARMLRAGLAGGTAVAVALGLGFVALAPAQASVLRTASEKVRTLQDPAITESSGLARSYYSDTRLWTTNDSGGGTTLYAIGKHGKTTRRFELTGAEHKDWEAMARTVIGGVSYLYIGDIGDNGKKRSSIFVHRVKEPKPSKPSGALTKYTTYEFRYPDGARNAEGMMVEPGTHRLYIISKVKGAPGGIYRAPATLSTTSVNVLTKVGTAPAGMSDAVFLKDGRFILRGYNNAWLYDHIGATPTGFVMPLKGESITHAWNSNYVFVGSEKRYSSIWRVRVP